MHDSPLVYRYAVETQILSEKTDIVCVPMYLGTQS